MLLIIIIYYYCYYCRSSTRGSSRSTEATPDNFPDLLDESGSDTDTDDDNDVSATNSSRRFIIYYLLLCVVLTGAVHAGEHQTPAPLTVLAGGHVDCNVVSFVAMLIIFINYYHCHSSRRCSRKRRPDLTPCRKKKPRIARGVLQGNRLTLGTVNALRDRILQHAQPDGSLPRNLKQMLKTVQKKIVKLQSKITKKPTVADVSVCLYCLCYGGGGVGGTV